MFVFSRRPFKDGDKKSDGKKLFSSFLIENYEKNKFNKGLREIFFSPCFVHHWITGENIVIFFSRQKTWKLKENNVISIQFPTNIDFAPPVLSFSLVAEPPKPRIVCARINWIIFIILQRYVLEMNKYFISPPSDWFGCNSFPYSLLFLLIVKSNWSRRFSTDSRLRIEIKFPLHWPLPVKSLEMAFVCVGRQLNYPGVNKFASLTFACLPMWNLLRRVPIKALFAIMAISSGRRMPTSDTNSTWYATRKLKQLHVEATLSGVAVAFANCKEKTRKGDKITFKVGLFSEKCRRGESFSKNVLRSKCSMQQTRITSPLSWANKGKKNWFDPERESRVIKVFISEWMNGGGKLRNSGIFSLCRPALRLLDD